MKKLYLGQNHAIWEIDKKENGLVEQMLPLTCTKAFIRSSENNTNIHNIGDWDSDCGIYVIGTIVEIENTFDQLFTWMKLRTNKQFINDLAESDSLNYLAMFKSDRQDIAVIIGGGYYQETDEDFLTLLYGLQNVCVGEIGANYTNHQGLYRTLMEDIDYISYMNSIKSMTTTKLEKINPIHIVLISEVFKYWQSNDIYTKQDRLAEDLIYVDNVILKCK